MPKVKFLTTITLAGVEVAAGHVEDINEDSAKALIRDGAAEAVEDEKVNLVNEVNPAILAGGEVNQEQDPGKAVDEVEKQRKALDAINKDELAKQAKEVGVEFAYDAKKAEIIEAIIAADKVNTIVK